MCTRTYEIVARVLGAVAIVICSTFAHAGPFRDFNGDGRSDLVWKTPTAWNRWQMNGLQPASSVTMVPGGGTAINPFLIDATGDYDGDGTTDVTWFWIDCSAGCVNNWQTWLSGGGTAAHPGSIWLFADFNGDGKSDTISNTLAGWAIRLAPGGSANVIVSGVSGWEPFRGAVWRAPDFDFNGDGKSDLLWTRQPTGEVAVYLMDGATIVEARMLWDASVAGWHVVGVGDFDGDGKSDILWKSDAGETAIWLMNGTSVVAASVVLGPSNWSAALVGDFDGDGADDVAWYNGVTGESAVWLMNGMTPHASGIIFQSPEWRAVQAGDFDGDGKADLLWRAPDGRYAIWLMNGLVPASAALLTPVPTNWQLQ